jgi:hypothetical protein
MSALVRRALIAHPTFTDEIEHEGKNMITQCDDEIRKLQLTVDHRAIIESDMRRLQKQVLQLIRIIDDAMRMEDVVNKLLELDKETKGKMVHYALSAYSKLRILRMRANSPLQEVSHLMLWALLHDLRAHALSTYMALRGGGPDTPLPFPDEKPMEIIVNSYEYSDVLKKLIRQDTDNIDRLFKRIL